MSYMNKAKQYSRPSGQKCLSVEELKRGQEYNIPLVENGERVTCNAMVERVTDKSVILKRGVLIYGSSSVGWSSDLPETDFFDEEREIPREGIDGLITEL